ncbi:hypothetical protein [Bordetella sp. 02P26C-1]|uniref:hypothetical protein n=1 Tax=Bordetella sp. 02P26C-1 TaxID=2683195 RepID=UPI00135471EC|nr:hypothetical protein [Bordetella sp. 02P26C-1]MVW79868.1 hypothetical protein [Bordetella sp. 02P26C-1]
MKSIRMSQLSIVAGGELQQYFEHRERHREPRFSIGAHGNRDGSTDFYVKDQSGNTILTKNSGVALGCYMVGTGVGTATTIFSGNPIAGGVAGFAAGHSCNALGHSSRANR